LTLETIFNRLGVETKKQKIMGNEISKEQEINSMLKALKRHQSAKDIFLSKNHKDAEIVQKLIDVLNKNSFMPIVLYLQKELLNNDEFKEWFNENYSFELAPVKDKISIYQILFDLYFHDDSKISKKFHLCADVEDVGFQNMDMFKKQLEEQNEIWGDVFVLVYKKFDNYPEKFTLTPKVNFTLTTEM
jgi:hypothetical protein